jgi:hypothetical protein
VENVPGAGKHRATTESCRSAHLCGRCRLRSAHRRRERHRQACCVASSRRQAKDPQAWERDYDAIRKSLQEERSTGFEGALPTFGRVLNFVGTTFGGSNPQRLAQSESLGDKAMSLAWSLIQRVSAAREADDSRLDPAVLARAAARATPSERAAAEQLWSAGGKDAETGALLSLGCVLCRCLPCPLSF